MSISKQIDGYRDLSLPDLRKEFLRVMGRPTNSGDKEGMVQKMSERLLTGGKTPPAQTEVATAPAATEKGKGKAKRAPATADTASPFTADPRLPAPGSTIKVTHKGKEYAAKFLGADGFEVEGKRYRSLSAAASEILGGVAVNGFLWWGLIKRSAPTAKPETPRAPKAKRAAKAKKAPRAKARKS